MTTESCERCGTDSGGLRIADLCVWCYAVVNDRPEDADGGEAAEVVET